MSSKRCCSSFGKTKKNHLNIFIFQKNILKNNSIDSKKISSIIEEVQKKYPNEEDIFSQIHLNHIISQLYEIFQKLSISLILVQFPKEENLYSYFEDTCDLSLESMLFLYSLSKNQKEISNLFSKRCSFQKIPNLNIGISFLNWISFFNAKSEILKQPKGIAMKIMKETLSNFRFGMGYDVVFYLACHEELIDVLKFVIDEDIIGIELYYDAYGNTPLHFSELYGNKEASKILRKKLEENNMIDEEDLTEFLEKHKGSIETLNLKK